MRKLLDNPYVVGLLVLVALIIVFKKPVLGLFEKVKQTQAVVPATPTNAIAKVTKTVTNIIEKPEPVILPDQPIEVESIQWILQPARNPFQRVKPPDSGDSSTNNAITEVPPDQPLELTGILFEKDKKLAVINNRVVQEGETIAGYKVESIERDYVILSGYGVKRRVNFGATEKPKDTQKPKKQ
jgi:type II secretory pathway component PulC